MNTKSLLTRIGVPVLSLGLLGGIGATLATSASASTLPAAATLSASVKPPTATVVASTHVASVPDTTVGNTGFYEDASGHMTTDPALSVYGPVWAIDDVTDTYRVTPLGNGDYAVDRQVNGTFEAFAQPNSGLPTVSPLSPSVKGQVHGTISYVVHSATGPVASNLLPEQPLATGSHAQLMQLFPGIADSDISGGSDWVFSYHAAHGSMTQRWDTDPSTWGNITG
jgi:hypothetical protein